MALERGENLPTPNPIPKRKRTTISGSISHKHAQSTRLNSKQRTPENPQGSASQPIELSNPVNEQDLQPELGGQDNPKPELEEGAGHSDNERRNEVGPPPTPNMGCQDDLLHDFVIGMAQVPANMNVYIQPEGSLNINLGETQSPRNFGYNRIMYSSKYTNCEEKIETEALQKLENQYGDTFPVENRHEGLDTKNIGQEEEVETKIIREFDN